MATPEDVLTGVAAAMETAVPELTTALPREADPTDNDVAWPHGEVIVVSNIRADQWNTDVTGFATDDAGNRIGYLLDAKFDMEVQLNVWIAVPSDDWNIQSLGGQLERGMRRYDANRRFPDPLPDGNGGELDSVSNFRITDGGSLPTETQNNPPHRGYQISASFRFTDRINTAEEYGASDYVAKVNTPTDEDMVDFSDSDAVTVELVAD